MFDYTKSKKENVVLYPSDYVILNSDGEFVVFRSGEIVIYANRWEAKEDAMYGDSIVSCTKLNEEKKKELIQNIIEFNS